MRSPALPRQTPAVDWDAQRGIFLVQTERPDWTRARQAYAARQVDPVLRIPLARPGLRRTLRRLGREIAEAFDPLAVRP